MNKYDSMLFIGAFSKNDLKNGKDKKAIKKVQKDRPELKYIYSKIKKDKLYVYLNDEFI